MQKTNLKIPKISRFQFDRIYLGIDLRYQSKFFCKFNQSLIDYWENSCLYRKNQMTQKPNLKIAKAALFQFDRLYQAARERCEASIYTGAASALSLYTPKTFIFKCFD